MKHNPHSSRVLIVDHQNSPLALPQRLHAWQWELVIQNIEALDPAQWPSVGIVHIPGDDYYAPLQAASAHLQQGSYIAICSKQALTSNRVQALLRDAFHDFLDDNVAPQRIAQLVERLLSESHHLREVPTAPELILGLSAEMTELRHKLSVYGHSDLPVLLQGESGTGKKCAARWIHQHSVRRAHPFVVMNCAAIPASRFAIELFGFEKGAFPGAHHGRQGLVHKAEGGTLFLDGIGDMSATNQATLLRFIESGHYSPSGSDQEWRPDVRMVCASNHHLYDEVQAGNFRLDLFHRLDVLGLSLPPLRTHPEDIPMLADHFLSHLDPPVSLDDSALEALMQYHFPGNVRELRNCLLKAAVNHRQGIIRRQDLGLGQPAEPTLQSQSLSQYRNLQEGNYIRQCLEHCQHNVQKTADRLQISRSSLYRLLEKHRITLP